MHGDWRCNNIKCTEAKGAAYERVSLLGSYEDRFVQGVPQPLQHKVILCFSQNWEKHKIYHNTWGQYFILELFISTMWVKFLITELLKGWITVALSFCVHAAYVWVNRRGNNEKCFIFILKQHISISSQNISIFFSISVFTNFLYFHHTLYIKLFILYRQIKLNVAPEVNAIIK